MKPLFQPPGSNLCGQTCIAMIADIGLDEATKIVGRGGKTRTKDIVAALRKLGFECGNKLELIRPGWVNVPSRCVIKLVFQKRRSHWIARWNDILYDPDKSEEMYGNGWKATSFLRIGGRHESA